MAGILGRSPARRVPPVLCLGHQGRRLGVKRCHLVSQSVDGALLKELFTHAGSGTVVSDAPLVVLRQARFDDLQRLLQIIRPLEQEGKLVPREEEMIELNLDHYTVVEHDGKLTGCVAMFDYPEAGMAELCCLAVAPPVALSRLWRGTAAPRRATRPRQAHRHPVRAHDPDGAFLYRARLCPDEPRRAAARQAPALQPGTRLQGAGTPPFYPTRMKK